MIYLLLGKDDFSKKEYLDEFGGTQKMQFFDGEIEPFSAEQVWQAYINRDLFGGNKTVLVRGAFAAAGFAEEFFALVDRADSSETSNILIFEESALDKRKKETKEILARKDFKIVEFEIPRGEEFRKWITARAIKYQLKLSGKALDLFLERMGTEADFGKEIYDLWQANSELQKLKAYAGDAQVGVEEVDGLVSQNYDENVFAITNAIGDKNKFRTVSLLTDYFERLPGVDEKTKIISLSALLAEQFRGILMIKDFDAQGMPDAQIAKAAGFTPGRVYIYKKLAQRFTVEKLLETLKKFELLDEEIKTSNGPAGLQFFMIIENVIR